MTSEKTIDLAKDYIQSRNEIEHLEELLKTVKSNRDLIQDELIESMAYDGVKQLEVDNCKLQMKKEVFGSCRGGVANKPQVLEVLQTMPELKHLITYNPDFNSKHVGSAIRELEVKAKQLWLDSNGVDFNGNKVPFDEHYYLPQSLIDVLNLSNAFTVSLTRLTDK